MKHLLCIVLILSAGLSQIAGPVPPAPLSQVLRLCEDTLGTWNTTTLSCDCPDGFTFDKDRGCHNTRAETLCTKTQGAWFVNNRKVPPVESCDCGLGKRWNDTDGCYGGILDSLLEAILRFLQSLVPSYMQG